MAHTLIQPDFGVNKRKRQRDDDELLIVISVSKTRTIKLID